MQPIGIANNDLFNETVKLFDQNKFCVSAGCNSERENVIAIRWYAFPKSSWCLISKDIETGFLISLLSNPNANKEKILDLLSNKI